MICGPFKAGIEAGAEAILVNHNVINSIDKDNPASLSKEVNKLLRETLEFSGIIITDDLDMGAVSKKENAVIHAVNAGNDLIIITDYKAGIEEIKNSLQDGRITEETINEHVKRIIAWKHYKELY